AAPSQAALGEGQTQATLREVVRSRQQAGRGGGREHGREPLLGIQVDGGRYAAQMSSRDLRPQRAAELGASPTEQHDLPTGPAEPAGKAVPHVAEDAKDPDDRRRLNRLSAGLVVEADIAAGHRDAKG